METYGDISITDAIKEALNDEEMENNIIELIFSYINIRVDINFMSEEGKTPLMYAIEEG